MKNGNFEKARLRLLKEEFKTKEGLFMFFVSSPLWAFLIFMFYNMVYEFFSNLFITTLGSIPGLGKAIAWYATVITMGLILRVFGVALMALLVRVHRWIIKNLKKV